MSDPVLTPEQEVEAQRLAELLAAKTKAEVLQMARLLVSKKDRQLFGKTEFELRDRCHRLGAQILQTALDERKKRAAKDQA
jgi:predicted GNAT family N-acyltransferase